MVNCALRVVEAAQPTLSLSLSVPPLLPVQRAFRPFVAFSLPFVILPRPSLVPIFFPALFCPLPSPLFRAPLFPSPELRHELPLPHHSVCSVGTQSALTDGFRTRYDSFRLGFFDLFESPPPSSSNDKRTVKKLSLSLFLSERYL